MSNTTVVVCLPDTIPTDGLRHAALISASSAGFIGRHVAPTAHFLIRRRRTRRLLQPWQGLAAGGPIKLLGLDAMEAVAAQQAWQRFTVWSQVVRGTRPAQPFWRFTDRYRQDPARYPLARAEQDYVAQPRIQAMSIYNATVARPRQIPIRELEALQVNLDAYVALARLRAVPAAGVVTLDRVLLAPADGRLSTLHGYLDRAQQHLRTLSGAHQLVSLTTG